jgi:hypothetical protein
VGLLPGCAKVSIRGRAAALRAWKARPCSGVDMPQGWRGLGLNLEQASSVLLVIDGLETARRQMVDKQLEEEARWLHLCLLAIQLLHERIHVKVTFHNNKVGLVLRAVLAYFNARCKPQEQEAREAKEGPEDRHMVALVARSPMSEPSVSMDLDPPAGEMQRTSTVQAPQPMTFDSSESDSSSTSSNSSSSGERRIRIFEVEAGKQNQDAENGDGETPYC